MKFRKPGYRTIAGGLFLIALFGSIGFFLMLLDRPEYRYIGYECQFNLIYNEAGPVDVAVIGSSRTQQGIGGPEIAKALEAAKGRPFVVYELGKSWRGQGINYTIIRDLLEKREVKFLLLEANLAETGIYHAHWYLVGRFRDFLESIWYQQVKGPNLIPFFDVLRLLADRFILRVSELAAGKLQPLSYRSVPLNARTMDCMKKDEPIRPVPLKERYEHFVAYKQQGTYWKWELYDKHQLHDTGFFKALVQLAREKGIPIHFYYVHERHYSRLDPAFAATFEKEIGAPLAIPPHDLVDRMEADGYADPTHFNAVGRKRYSEWLAQVIAPRLPGM